MDEAHCAFVLRRGVDEDGIARVGAWLTQHGFTVTSTGRVTVSFVAPTDALERLLGTTIRRVSPEPASEWDFGAPAGTATTGEPTVPEELEDVVETVSIEPPATRLGS